MVWGVTCKHGVYPAKAEDVERDKGKNTSCRGTGKGGGKVDCVTSSLNEASGISGRSFLGGEGKG